MMMTTQQLSAAVRAATSFDSAETQQLLSEFRTRLLLWCFGMSVIAQLWLWPLLAVAALKSWVIGYVIYTGGGPGRDACEQEEPWGAPWRHVAVWRHMADYHSARLVRTAELDPQGRYVFACYPHGVSAIGGWLSFATEATGFSKLFPGIRPYCLTLASNFRCPLLREYCLKFGLRSCARRACVRLLDKPGAAIVLYPGGAAEALVTETGRFNLILSRRKGFARVAVATGASLVPVFGFGETDLFETWVPPRGSLTARLQRLSHRYWGTSQPLFRGAGVFTDSGLLPGLLPLPRPVTTVVGAPIPVRRVDADVEGQAAFDAAVDAAHAQYVAALAALFDAHKEAYAPRRRGELAIVG